MKIGDIVEWSSQAGGNFKTKLGPIVAVVPIKRRPSIDEFPDLYSGPGCGFGRREESYVVKVKNKHYWPRVSALRVVTA